jgi:hypothetical protein
VWYGKTDRSAALVHHPIKEGWKFLRLVQRRQFSIPYLRYAVLRKQKHGVRVFLHNMGEDIRQRVGSLWHFNGMNLKKIASVYAISSLTNDREFERDHSQ